MLILLVATIAAGCSAGGSAERNSNPGRGGRGGRAPQAIPVAAVETRPRDLARTVTVTGPVEPMRSVSVNALAAGTVQRVLVEEGNRVRAGQLMAELDGREVSAQYERARAVLANAESAFQRAQELRARELTSAAELDAARSAYETAKADADLWRTRVDFTRITAPVAGMVTAKLVERGGAVSSNQTMFEIADDATLVVRVRISEMDVVNLSPGRTVAMQLDAYPGVRLSGRIRRIFPSADAQSRLVPVEVVLGSTPRGVEAKPGFLARVEFALEHREGVLAVPTAAVGVSEGAPYVYVVSADTLVRRPVETGLTASGWIEVRRGLSAGERVVSSGHANLRPGAAVRISDSRL
jgi:RND family efflux transporter MFP subunit